MPTFFFPDVSFFSCLLIPNSMLVLLPSASARPRGRLNYSHEKKNKVSESSLTAPTTTTTTTQGEKLKN